jgi:hypothetical protein
MPIELQLWWGFLCAVSVLNLSVWLWSAHRVHREGRGDGMGADASPETEAHRRWRQWQLLLSAGYVIGCGFRSFWPVFDVQRQVLVDHWLSSAAVGRSVATVAELCFAAQWALVLRTATRAAGSRSGEAVANLIVPLIVVAEVCSWTAVLTTSNLGHVAEESLWGLCAALFVASLVAIWPRVDASLRPLLRLWGLAACAYALYMVCVDVPMYAARWLADEAAGRSYLSLAQGWADASARWVVSHRWDDWRSEVTWMSLYFSVAVWFSLALIHAPRRFIVPSPARSAVRWPVVAARRSPAFR